MKKTTEKWLEKARSAINNGDLNSARKYIQKIKNNNNNADALNILALCHAMSNELSKAEILFQQSINLSKPTEGLLTNLALAQLHQKKTALAITSFLKAEQLNPSSYETIKNIAICYDYISDQKNAIKYAKKAYKIKTEEPEIINILAKNAYYNNDTNRSITFFKHSLSLQPQQPYIYKLLADAHTAIKKYDEAENTLLQALNIFSDNIYLRNSLGTFYEIRNRQNEALVQYEQILKNHSDNTFAISAKARALISLKKFSISESFLLQAHKIHPENPEIGAELCNYFILKKSYEKAYELSKKILLSINNNELITENIALAHSTACRLTNRFDEAKNILTTIIEKKGTNPTQLESFYFSMGDILDKMKQYDDAFHYYKTANEIVSRPTDIQYYEKILIDISTSINKNFLDSKKISGNKTTLPVFIVGMPRSGTSLVEQIISSHPKAFGAGELTHLWTIGNTISGAMNLIDYTKNLTCISQEEITEFSKKYIQEISALTNNDLRITDKLPHNFMHIGLIELLFPNAKIIHCQRHPFDTCLSIYFKKFNDNHVYSKSLEELSRFYKQYMALMKHWNEVSSLPILTVKYEDMVVNRELESRRIIKHLDLDWSDDVLHYFNSDRVIMTPSHHQASKPIYTDSMYRWKHYKEHLNELTKVLGDPLKYM